MTATNHVLTGAVVALAVKQPLLAIPLAFLSHFAIDLIPHFEARDLRKFTYQTFALDGLAAAGLIVCLPLFLVSDVSGWLIFGCMLAAMLPDLIWVWRYLRLGNIEAVFVAPWSWFSKLHYNMQWRESLWGGGVELVWLLFMAFSLSYLSSR
jgi:hypothetical protein